MLHFRDNTWTVLLIAIQILNVIGNIPISKSCIDTSVYLFVFISHILSDVWKFQFTDRFYENARAYEPIANGEGKCRCHSTFLAWQFWVLASPTFGPSLKYTHHPTARPTRVLLLWNVKDKRNLSFDSTLKKRYCRPEKMVKKYLKTTN